ncbi:protein-tyrosine phosphatase family protein [Cellulomonas humilata]|uniref:Tyrosine specific protein phosphatases domain-containing protein n=1 Tax=Cellulomonas humilata TaxID=144055 RepID=A0ABU0ELV8_9CELL|nr:hypothetical protein [Cellulomonas humilata]MDQ0376000.1 hypothetical protein [Cellulomonas humilata]
MSAGTHHANASQLTANLWIGGDFEVTDPDLAALQVAELVAAGLSDVVDLRLEWDDEDWFARRWPALEYRWLGVDDAGQRMPGQWFDEGVGLILSRIEAGGVVLAHCHMGINRGPSMGFAVLLAQGWDAIEALDVIREARPIAYVGYAEDALNWWLRKQGASRADRAVARRRIAQWRRDNHLDVNAVIRRIRRKETAAKPAA